MTDDNPQEYENNDDDIVEQPYNNYINYEDGSVPNLLVWMEWNEQDHKNDKQNDSD